MATTTTTVSPQPVPFPYSGMPDVIGEKTGIPRGEISFSEPDGSIIVAESAELQRLNIRCCLPIGYAYVLREMHLSLSGADTADWSLFGHGIWQDAETASIRKHVMAFPLFSPGVIPLETLTRSNYRSVNIPKQVVLPVSTAEGPILIATLVNPVADGTLMKFLFSARFLQYDIEQSFHYSVNSPAPVR